MKNIYELGLHEETWNESGLMGVTRVPGGWIYQFISQYGDAQGNISYMITATFVPMNGEFK